MRSCDWTATFRWKFQYLYVVEDLYPRKQPLVPRSRSLLRCCLFLSSLGTWSQTIQPNGLRSLRSFFCRGFPYHRSYGISSSIAEFGNLFQRYVAVFTASTQKELGILACASIARTMLFRVRFMRSAFPLHSGVLGGVGSYLIPSDFRIGVTCPLYSPPPSTWSFLTFMPVSLSTSAMYSMNLSLRVAEDLSLTLEHDRICPAFSFVDKDEIVDCIVLGLRKLSTNVGVYSFQLSFSSGFWRRERFASFLATNAGDTFARVEWWLDEMQLVENCCRCVPIS